MTESGLAQAEQGYRGRVAEVVDGVSRCAEKLLGGSRCHERDSDHFGVGIKTLIGLLVTKLELRVGNIPHVCFSILTARGDKLAIITESGMNLAGLVFVALELGLQHAGFQAVDADARVV